MNRDAVVTAVIALLAVLAIALGAATLDPVETGGGIGLGEGEGSGPGDEEEFQSGGQSQRNASSSGGGPLPPLVGRILLAIAIVTVLIGLYGLYRHADLRTLATIAAGVILAAIAIYIILQVFGSVNSMRGNGTIGSGPMELPGGGGGLGGDDSGIVPSNPPLLVLAAFGLVLVGGAVVALRSTRGGDEPATEPEVETGEDTEVAAIGRAAGRAADRIDDDADTTNEVYRAWEEMTDHLDVANPRASTPGEFATAADEAGMGREDVSRLTDLFRGTRYGGRAITDERESRAVAALRRIEEEYTAEDTGDRSTGDRDDRGARR